MRNPLAALDAALVPLLARALRRTVDVLRFAPGDAGRRVDRATLGARRRTRRLDARHTHSGVLGFVRDLPQAGFVAIGVLLVVGALAIVRLDGEHGSDGSADGNGSGGTPGAASAVAKGCPAGTLAPGQSPGTVGPDPDQPVPTYLQQTAATLSTCATADPGATFFAVVSLDRAKVPADVAGALNGVTVVQVFVDIPGATATPRVLAVTGGSDGLVKVTAAVSAAYDAAAVQFEQDGQLQSAQASSITPRNAVEQQGKLAFEQAATADAQQAHQLRASCACTYGAVVVGSLSELVALQTSSVRAIQLAPAGTVPGDLTGRPLLPAETSTLSTAAAPSVVEAGSL